ncbi:hypothetical protein FOZ60_011027 [Perkinsus olseni]|uniref:Uncharacterized protein n=4 Tax=Perkinsus olseni TaxID=32597 RepID=A0A7J6NE42_PEROL|nr:hypothetical protein FOZ60_011027 [Perkinsus olseni]
MIGVAQKRTDTSHGNSLIARREFKRQQQKHRETIRRMQPSIDTRRPADHKHLTLYGRDYYAKKRQITESAYNDLKMIQSIAQTMTRSPELLGSARRPGPVSLNREYRKRELFRITLENHALLGRLERLRPYYSTARLERDYLRHMRYMVQSSAHAYSRGRQQHPVVEKIKAREKAAKYSEMRSRPGVDQQTRRSLGGSRSSPSLRKNSSVMSLGVPISTTSSYCYLPPDDHPATTRDLARVVVARVLGGVLGAAEASRIKPLSKGTQDFDEEKQRLGRHRAPSSVISSVDDSSEVVECFEGNVEHETASRTVEDLIDAAADLFTDMDDDYSGEFDDTEEEEEAEESVL